MNRKSLPRISTVRQTETRWAHLLIIICLAFVCYFFLCPAELNVFAWRTAVIFVATIICIICRVLPIGALGLIAITIYALTYSGGAKLASESITDALSAMNNSLIWLIVIAFMIARGFIKTGLGQRIALILVKILGKRTLGLAYGLALADLLLAPAMPSNTARCGGLFTRLLILCPVVLILSLMMNPGRK